MGTGWGMSLGASTPMGWGGKDARCPQRTWFCLERMADIRLRLALSTSPASGAIPQKPNPGVSRGVVGKQEVR